MTMKINPFMPRRTLSLTVIGFVCCCLAIHALAHPGHDPENALRCNEVLVDTSFEPDQAMPPSPQHQVVMDKARTGKHSLMGKVAEPKQACSLRIPFQAKAGTELSVSFQVCGDRGPSASIWLRVRDERTRLTTVDLEPEWRQVRASYVFANDTEGTVEIFAPSSWETGEPGRAWVDDLLINVVELHYRAEVQSFPAVAHDQIGNMWLAVVERLTPSRSIGLYRIEKGEPVKLCSLETHDLTGVSAPAVAGLANGCIVAFPAEQKDRWGIAYAFVNAQTAKPPELKFIPCGGNANINPAIAVSDNRAWVVWESNVDGYRSIYGCCIDSNNCTEPQRLSAPEANSYNPAIVALKDHSLFSAWDSIRGSSADLYGASCHEGQWQPERRLTSQARIARHPALGTWEKQIWIAFQAQSYKGITLNNLDDQRIVVAHLSGNQLLSPKRFFTDVSDPQSKLTRPRLAFDTSGRLWLTARKSIADHEGWSPLVWCYNGGTWSNAETLLDNPGRWQPVPMSFSATGAVAAVEFDDQPGYRRYDVMDVGWKANVQMVPLSLANAPAARPLETEPLKFPATDFSLAEATDRIGASFPRQQVSHRSHMLKAYFGDFHEHTDLSICGRATNPSGHDLFANIRDIERLDFIALTDHDYDFDQTLWDFNGEQTRNNHDPGRFVTFLGHEWTSSRNPGLKPGDANRYGHHNLIFLDPHFNRFFNSFAGDISPADVWKQLNGVSFICIPHQLADWQGRGKGNPPTDWTFVDELLQPVAEIFQARGSYEYLGCPRQSKTATPFNGYFIQDAWAKDIVIGVIASPDHGGGKGKVGVWASELTREAIFEAVRARHTFGTSGTKMSLYFCADDALMGDKVHRLNGPVTFQVRAKALRDIKELVIFRNNEILFRQEPGQKEVETNWIDTRPPAAKNVWYYARIQTTDDELAWSSPIWFSDNPPQSAQK